VKRKSIIKPKNMETILLPLKINPTPIHTSETITGKAKNSNNLLILTNSNLKKSKFKILLKPALINAKLKKYETKSTSSTLYKNFLNIKST
jgi:hypothetical protein